MWILNLNKHFNKPVIPEILKTWREVKLRKCSYWEVSGDSQRDLSGLYAEAAAEWIVLIMQFTGQKFHWEVSKCYLNTEVFPCLV